MRSYAKSFIPWLGVKALGNFEVIKEAPTAANRDEPHCFPQE